MEKNKFYLIQGIFFEDRGHVVQHTIFCGVIDTSRDIGAITDRIGNSIITDVHIEDTMFSFKKKYEEKNRDYVIDYEFFFDSQSNTYNGHWKFTWDFELQTCYAKCVIHEIDNESFFNFHEVKNTIDQLVDLGLSNMIESKTIIQNEFTSKGDDSDELPF